jgi:hypothetical protein
VIAFFGIRPWSLLIKAVFGSAWGNAIDDVRPACALDLIQAGAANLGLDLKQVGLYRDDATQPPQQGSKPQHELALDCQRQPEIA